MNSDPIKLLKEIMREFKLALNQYNPQAKNLIITINPIDHRQNFNFISPLFKDAFATLTKDTQIYNPQERTNWKKDILRHYLFKLVPNQQSARIVIMIPSSDFQNIIPCVRNTISQFGVDQGLSIIIYDTPKSVFGKNIIFESIEQIINQKTDVQVCSLLDKLYNSWRIIHMDQAEIQDKVEIENFLLPNGNPINQKHLETYFAKQQLSEDELRKCQRSLQKQFDQQFDQIIAILLENLETSGVQNIIEQETLTKLLDIEERVNDFKLGINDLQELISTIMEANQLLSQEVEELPLDDLNVYLEIMDFYNRYSIGEKFTIKLQVKVGLNLAVNVLKYKKKGSSCVIM